MRGAEAPNYDAYYKTFRPNTQVAELFSLDRFFSFCYRNWAEKNTDFAAG